MADDSISDYTDGFKEQDPPLFPPPSRFSLVGRKWRIAKKTFAAKCWRFFAPKFETFTRWLKELKYDMHHGVRKRAADISDQDVKTYHQHLVNQNLATTLKADIETLKAERTAIERSVVKAINVHNQRNPLLQPRYGDFDSVEEQLAKNIQDHQKTLADPNITEGKKIRTQRHLQDCQTFQRQLFHAQSQCLAINAKIKIKQEHRQNIIRNDSQPEVYPRGLANRWSALIVGFFTSGPIGLIIALFGWKHIKQALWHGAAGKAKYRPGYDLHIITPSNGSLEPPEDLSLYQGSYLLLKNQNASKLYYIFPQYHLKSNDFPIDTQQYKNSLICIDEPNVKSDYKYLWVDKKGNRSHPTEEQSLEFSWQEISLSAKWEGVLNKIPAKIEYKYKSGLVRKRILPEELSQLATKDYNHVEPNPRSLRGAIGAGLLFPVVGWFIAFPGLRNLFLPFAQFVNGIFWGIGLGATLGYRPIKNFSHSIEHFKRHSYTAKLAMIIFAPPFFVISGIFRAAQDFFHGVWSGIIAGCQLSFHYFSKTVQEAAKKDIESHHKHRQWLAFLGMPISTFLLVPLALSARWLSEIFWGIGTGIRHAFLLGIAQFKFTYTRTSSPTTPTVGPAVSEANRLKDISKERDKHRKHHRYLTIIFAYLISLPTFAFAFMGRQLYDIGVGIKAGLTQGFLSFFRHFNQTARDDISKTFNQFKEKRNFLAYPSSVVIGLLMMPFALFLRETRDLLWGFCSGIKFGALLAWAQFKWTYPQGTENSGNHLADASANAKAHWDNLRFSAFPAAAIGGIFIAPIAFIARQSRDLFSGFIDGIKHGALLGSYNLMKTVRDDAKEQLKTRWKNRSYAAYITTPIAIAIVTPIFLVGRQVWDLAYGVCSGIKHGLTFGASYFSDSSLMDALESTQDHADNHRYLTFASAFFTGIAMLPVGFILRQLRDLWYGIKSGIEYGAKLGWCQLKLEDPLKAAKADGENLFIKEKAYAAFVSASAFGIVMFGMAFITRQLRDFIYGICSGIQHNILVPASQFDGNRWQAAKQSFTDHFKERRFFALLGMVLTTPFIFPLFLIGRQCRDLFYGLLSGIKHTFTVCWNNYARPQSKAYTDALEDHIKQKRYVGYFCMIAGTCIAAVPAFVAGAIINIKSLLPWFGAACFYLAKNVIWKGAKAAIFSPGKLIGGFFGNLRGGVNYAFQKTCYNFLKLIPIVRQWVPGFRSWKVAVEPLKQKLSSTTTTEESHAESNPSPELIDEANNAFIAAVKGEESSLRRFMPECLFDHQEYDKSQKQHTLKKCHEYFLEGKVEFSHNGTSWRTEESLPSYKFRFSDKKTLPTEESLAIQGTSHLFTCSKKQDSDKLIITVTDLPADSSLPAAAAS